MAGLIIYNPFTLFYPLAFFLSVNVLKSYIFELIGVIYDVI